MNFKSFLLKTLSKCYKPDLIETCHWHYSKNCLKIVFRYKNPEFNWSWTSFQGAQKLNWSLEERGPIKSLATSYRHYGPASLQHYLSFKLLRWPVFLLQLTTVNTSYTSLVITSVESHHSVPNYVSGSQIKLELP